MQGYSNFALSAEMLALSGLLPYNVILVEK